MCTEPRPCPRILGSSGLCKAAGCPCLEHEAAEAQLGQAAAQLLPLSPSLRPPGWACRVPTRSPGFRCRGPRGSLLDMSQRLANSPWQGDAWVCRRVQTKSKCKGRSHGGAAPSGHVQPTHPSLSPSCGPFPSCLDPTLGSPTVCISCTVKEGFSGGLTSLALCSPICLAPSLPQVI